MILAAITLPELAPILTINAGMLLGFYGLLKYILGQSEKSNDSERVDRKEATAEREAFIKAIEDMAVSNREIAEETRTGNQEAKDRNGHLGEQNIKIAKLITNQNTDVKDMRNSNAKIAQILAKSAHIDAQDRETLLSHTQHVENQVVENQTINKKE